MLTNLLRLPEGKSTLNIVVDKPNFEDLNFLSKLEINLSSVRKNNKFKIEVNYKTKIEEICDKCLDEYENIIDDTVSVMIAEEVDIDPDNSYHYPIEDYDMGFDFVEFVYQELYMNESHVHLCKEDCKGLCQGCGVNLNKEICKCN